MGIDLVPTLHFYENGNLNGTIEGVHRKEYIDEDFQLKENSASGYSLQEKPQRTHLAKNKAVS